MLTGCRPRSSLPEAGVIATGARPSETSVMGIGARAFRRSEGTGVIETGDLASLVYVFLSLNGVLLSGDS